MTVKAPPILAVPVMASVPPEIEAPEMFPVLVIPVFAVRSPDTVVGVFKRMAPLTDLRIKSLVPPDTVEIL